MSNGEVQTIWDSRVANMVSVTGGYRGLIEEGGLLFLTPLMTYFNQTSPRYRKPFCICHACIALHLAATMSSATFSVKDAAKSQRTNLEIGSVVMLGWEQVTWGNSSETVKLKKSNVLM